MTQLSRSPLKKELKLIKKIYFLIFPLSLLTLYWEKFWETDENLNKFQCLACKVFWVEFFVKSLNFLFSFRDFELRICWVALLSCFWIFWILEFSLESGNVHNSRKWILKISVFTLWSIYFFQIHYLVFGIFSFLIEFF